MNKPQVSVIVPVYNVERYINKCVDSIINQTYRDIEIILVNDGSQDRCPQICDYYKSIDTRIKVIHKLNGGLSDARNTGVSKAVGEYIIFVDSDDYIEDTLIEKVLPLVKKNNAEVAIWGYYSDFEDEDQNLVESKQIHNINGVFDKDDFNSIDINYELVNLLGYAWNKIYHRKFLVDNNFKFLKDISLVEDMIFNSKVLTKCEKIVFLDEPLIHYMHRPRITLGTQFYENFFQLKKMAMSSIRELLVSWSIDKKKINKIISLIGFTSLKTTVSALSKYKGYSKKEKKVYLEGLLNEKEVDIILKEVEVELFKDNLIRFLFKLKWIELTIWFYKLK